MAVSEQQPRQQQQTSSFAIPANPYSHSHPPYFTKSQFLPGPTDARYQDDEEIDELIDSIENGTDHFMRSGGYVGGLPFSREDSGSGSGSGSMRGGGVGAGPSRNDNGGAGGGRGGGGGGGGGADGDGDAAARRREIRALRTPKACDICKIRKVKCDGGEPCASCQLHDSNCQYSKVTRKNLLSRTGGGEAPMDPPGSTKHRRVLGGSSASSGTSPAPGGSAGLAPGMVVGGNGNENEVGGVQSAGGTVPSIQSGIMEYFMDPNTVQGMGMSRIMQGHGMNNGVKGQAGPVSARSHYPVHQDDGPRQYASNHRQTASDPYLPPTGYYTSEGPTRNGIELDPTESIHEGNTTWGKGEGAGSMQNLFGNTDRRGELVPEDRIGGESSGGSGPYPGEEFSPENLGSGSSGQIMHGHSPLSPELQRSVALGSSDERMSNTRRRSASPYRSANVSGNDVRHERLTREEQIGVSSGQPDFTKSYGVGEAGLAAGDSPQDGPENSRRSSAQTLGYGSAAAIMGAECDVLGNAGIATFQPAPESGLQWWGASSYITWQNRLQQVLRIMEEGRYMKSSGPSLDTKPGDLWRWGAAKLFFRERAKPKPDPAFDSLFLPTTLAHRFFWSYCTILHPVWPILDLEEVRRSIAAAYAGGVTYGISPQVTPSETARQLATARNLIVLALGARIEGGDGDAHCPKDVAKNWALVLAERSKAILLQHGLVSVSVEASKLWLLHSLDMTNHGYADESYMAVGNSARQMLALGLHREATSNLPGAANLGCRMTFWSCFVMEKFVSLWTGRPSSLNISAECDVLLPKAGNAKSESMAIMIQLARLTDRIALMYHNRDTEPALISALESAQGIFEELNELEVDMPARLRNFDFRSEGEDRIDLDTEEGEIALLRFNLNLHVNNLKMIIGTPLLSYLTWERFCNPPSTIAVPPRAFEIAEMSVAAAVLTVQACHLLFVKIPYLPFMGSFANHLLYAVPILFLDVLRKRVDPQSRPDMETLHMATRCLEQMDHPASEVCKAMLQDVFQVHVDQDNARPLASLLNPLTSPRSGQGQGQEMSTWSSGRSGTQLLSR